MDVGSVRQYDFEVDQNERAAEGIWRLRIHSHVARDLIPGQFMNLQVPGDGSHILRIPLSFAKSSAVTSRVELLYAVVGEGTERLSKMRTGDTSTLLGPCGKGWSLPTEQGRALLVAGGIGLPPILAAAGMLAERGIGYDLVVGARTKEMLLMSDIKTCVAAGGDDALCSICTDDGSFGLKGFTTDAAKTLMAGRDYVQVYTCGPNVMMAGVAKLAAEKDVDCQVSMERMMGCGFGACSCCNVALVGGGYALCCQDGPVFNAREVVW